MQRAEKSKNNAGGSDSNSNKKKNKNTNDEVEIGKAQEFHIDVDLRRLAESCSKLGEPFAQFVKRLRNEVVRIRDGVQHDIPQIPLLVREAVPYIVYKTLFTICLPKYPYLRKVQLHYCALGDDGVLLLTSFIKSYKPAMEKNPFGIDVLELPGCEIGTRGATALGKLFTENTTVQKLVLDFNALGEEGVAKLCDGIQWNNSLKQLSLEYCSINGLGASVIAQTILRTSAIQVLSLCGNALGDDGVCEIGLALGCNANLVELDLTDVNFGESTHTAEILSEAIEISKHLTCLKLNNNTLCEKAAHLLCNSIKCNHVLTDVTLDERVDAELYKIVLDTLSNNRKSLKKGKKSKKNK